MSKIDENEIREAVRARYAEAARAVGTSCCAPASASQDAGSLCCASASSAEGLIGRTLYGDNEAEVLPQAALEASLGCGNPTMLADLRPGQVVLDLGSGGGVDVLLSARRVAPDGKAYGLDMTKEMLGLARRNQAEAGIENAEFLEGTMEDVPLPDGSVDVIISNCVVNLSPNKDAVFREAFRVLRPGGRLAISDIVLRKALPDSFQQVVGLWTGCVAGALVDADYEKRLEEAGFEQADIEATQVYDGSDLLRMAGELKATSGMPEDIAMDEEINELDGAV
ncbi:MAG: arsenite methyltransferase, partial [Nitrososphaerales archaeon]